MGAARHAQQLKDDIKREQQTKQQFDALLTQTEQIEQNNARFGSLNNAIPRLENIYKERARLEAMRRKEQEYHEKLVAIVEELPQLQTQQKQAKDEHEVALREEAANNKRLKDTEAYQDTLRQQAAQIQQI